MKTTIFTLIISLLVFSCKTKDPSLADGVKGTYKLVSTKLKNAKVDGLTGTFTVKAVADDQVTITVKLTFDGDSETDDYSNLTLKPDGSDLDIYQGTGLVGTFSGNNLIFTIDSTGGLFEFTATK
jgi:hypothetical protein